MPMVSVMTIGGDMIAECGAMGSSVEAGCKKLPQSAASIRPFAQPSTDGAITSVRVDYPRRHNDFSGEDARVLGYRIARGITVLRPLLRGVFRPF